MSLRLAQVNVKARDEVALGRFWAQALGWELSVEEPGVAAIKPAERAAIKPGEKVAIKPGKPAVGIDVVAVDDPDTVTYRVHLDLATTSPAHHAHLVERLIGLGATPADVGQGDAPWTVLADPEGNVFCVLEPRDVYRDTGPIAAVVVDCADPRAMAAFWGAAIDWAVLEVTDDAARMRADTGPYLEFLRVPGTSTGWRRMHLDLVADPVGDQMVEVARLLRLGATRTDVGQGDDVPWRVLADPAGTEFCVLGRSAG